jgi:hypothetical protein
MACSQARIDANKRNATRSTGPRSEAGKSRSRYNGMVHGLRSEVAVMPSENPAEYDERLLGVADSLQPRSTVEELLVHQIASTSWQYDRAVRVESAHVAAIIENAANRELEEVHSLANRLFATRGELPIEIWGTIEWEHAGPRPSHPPLPDDPEDPAKIVRQLESSVAGCQWMIERLTELRELLEPGRAWEAHHKLKFVRLLGRRPLDVANRFDLAVAFVAAWSINPVLDDAYSELQCELGPKEYTRFTDLVRRTWENKMINAVDRTNARNVLISLVEQAIARVKAKAVLAQERAERNAQRTVDCLSIDTSRQGELIQRYKIAANRKFTRSLAEFVKIRRARADGYIEHAADSDPQSGSSDQGSENSDQGSENSVQGSENSVQFSVFSVQLNEAQPSAEQLVSSVCVGGANDEPATGQAPTQHTTNQQPNTSQAADPQNGSSDQGSENSDQGSENSVQCSENSVQCSVSSVQLNEAQPSAEQLVSVDDCGPCSEQPTTKRESETPRSTHDSQPTTTLAADPQSRSSVQGSENSDQFSVFSVQLDAAQPLAEQLVNSVCVGGGNDEPAIDQAPTLPTTNEQSTTDPLSWSSDQGSVNSDQFSVFSVQLDDAQPPAEQLVSFDDGGPSTASGGVASVLSNPLGNEANSFLPTEPNDRAKVEPDTSDPRVNPVESKAPDVAGCEKERENREVTGPDTAAAQHFPAAMELLLSIILVISCALWCLSASAAEVRVRSIPTRPATANTNTVSPQRFTGVHPERTNTVSPQRTPRITAEKKRKGEIESVAEPVGGDAVMSSFVAEPSACRIEELTDQRASPFVEFRSCQSMHRYDHFFRRSESRQSCCFDRA